MKKILLITTGGTIACRQTGNGLAPGLTPEDILSYIPSVKNICEVHTSMVCHIDSFIYAVDDNSHNVNVVFNGKVIAGTRVRKERTKTFNAFSFTFCAKYTCANPLYASAFFIADKYFLIEKVGNCFSLPLYKNEIMNAIN